MEADRDKACGRRQLNVTDFFKMAAPAPAESPDDSPAIAAVDGLAARRARRGERDYDDAVPDYLSFDECIEHIESAQPALFSGAKKYNINTNYCTITSAYLWCIATFSYCAAVRAKWLHLERRHLWCPHLLLGTISHAAFVSGQTIMRSARSCPRGDRGRTRKLSPLSTMPTTTTVC
jgi:hypothetical protein